MSVQDAHGREVAQGARRGSTSSLAGDPSFLWEASSVTPAAYLEAETTWRNTLGAQHVRRGRPKRSKSTGALGGTRAIAPEPVWAPAVPVPGPQTVPLELSFWGMVGRELGWGSVFQRSHDTNRPSSHIANFMSVPLRMERFVSFGHLVALDLFLFHITWLPLRVVSSALLGVLALCRLAAPARLWDAVASCAARYAPIRPGSGCGSLVFGHAQQFDVLKAAIIAFSTLVLGSVQLGRLYHYIRGEATLKLYVFFNILSVLDTLASSFGQDVLDALLKTTRDAAGDVLSVEVFTPKNPTSPLGPGTRKKQRQALGRLAFYSFLAVVYVSFHAAVIFVQAVCLNVAVNSRGNALLPLLVSSNFMELKSSVFKRYEAEQLFQISCSDAVERFVLSLHLLLIALQQSSMSWSDTWQFAGTIAVIWFFEVLVDFVKHSFITKFNRLSADLYGTFAGIIAHDVVSDRARFPTSLDPTHASARRLGLATIPLTCVVLRIATTNFLPTWLPRLSAPVGVFAAILGVAVLWAAKLLSTMVLLIYSAAIVEHQKGQLEKAATRQANDAAKAAAAVAVVDDTGSDEQCAWDAGAPPPITLDLARAVSVGSSSVNRRCRAAVAREVSSSEPIASPPAALLTQAASVGFFIGEAGAPLISLKGDMSAAFVNCAEPSTATADTASESHRLRSASLPTRPRCEGGESDATASDGAVKSTSEATHMIEASAGLLLPSSGVPVGDVRRVSVKGRQLSTVALDASPEQVDAPTAAQLESLLMMGELSKVERYSLLGRPAPM